MEGDGFILVNDVYSLQNPPPDQFIELVDVLGVTMNARYQDVGEGEIIFYMHGLGGSIEIAMPHLAAAVARGYRFIAVDFPGHGGTDTTPERHIYSSKGYTAFAQRFLDAIGIEKPFHFMAHSLAGIPATRFAISMPEYVKKLTLISPAGFHRDIGWHYRMLSVPAVRPVAFSNFSIDLLKWAARRDKNSEMIDDDHIEVTYEYLRQNGGRAVAWCLQNETGFSGFHYPFSTEELQTVTAPTLLFWGSKDVAMPTYHYKSALNIPNSKVVLLDGSYHRPQIRYPDAVNNLMFEFLETGDIASVAPDERVVTISPES